MSRPDRSTRRASAWRVKCGAPAFGLLLLVAGASLIGTALAEEKVKRKDEPDRLSDAARETAKAPDQQRTLHADDRKPQDAGSTLQIWISGAGGSVGSDDDGSGMAAPDVLRMVHVGAVAATSSLSTPDFASTTLYGLRIGISNHGRTSFDLVFLGGAARFLPGSDLSARFRRPGELALDGSLRYSLTPPYARAGIAPVVGFRVGRLSWRYLHGIWLERDGYERQVLIDTIDHYSPYLGLAVTALRTRHVELGITGLTGWRYYGSHTDAGLENDLFGRDRFSELRLETRFGL